LAAVIVPQGVTGKAAAFASDIAKPFASTVVTVGAIFFMIWRYLLQVIQ
jgi:hypothetical protein